MMSAERARKTDENRRSLLLRGGRMTKWKGIAASYAPSMGLASSASAIALGAAFLFAPAAIPGTGSAWAACTNTGGSNWSCSGVNTTPLAIEGPWYAPLINPTVTTMSGFEAQKGIRVGGQGAVSYTDVNAVPSVYTGDGYGAALEIGARNILDGSGNPIAPGSLYLESNGVFTGYSGVSVENSASGPTTVKLSGDITAGASGTGVLVRTGAADADVTTSGTITAGGFGIATDVGGITTVVANGDVTSSGVGIQSTNGNGSGSISVTANGNVTASVSGITATNRGPGSVKVVATRSVTAIGDNGRGIWINNEDFWGGPINSQDLTVEADDVTGRIAGILATNNGEGYTKITATGAVTALDGTGISASNGNIATGMEIHALDDVWGGSSGIQAANSAGGQTSVEAAGTVTGVAGNGISAWGSSAGTDVSVSAAAVSGGQTGISASNTGTGSTTVSASGHVDAAGGNGIDAYAGATGST